VIALRQEARNKDMHRPRTIQEGVDWEALDDQVTAYNAALAESPLSAQVFPGDRGKRHEALNAIYFADPAPAAARWQAQPKPPADFIETAGLALAYAAAGDDKAQPLISRVKADSPTDAAILTALLAYQQGRYADAAALSEQALHALRKDATVIPRFVEYALRLPAQIVEKEPQHAERLCAVLGEPLAVYMLEERRLLVRCAVAQRVSAPVTASAVLSLEPHVPWDLQVLEMRASAYQALGHSLASRAQRELLLFRRNMPEQLVLSP